MKEATAIPTARYRPSLSLSEKDLPDIKDWKVGKQYDLILRVKQVSANSDLQSMETGNKLSKPSHHARFEIMSVEAPESTQKLNESDFTAQKIKRLEEKSKEYN